MVEATAIGSALTSIKAAYEITKGLIGIRDAVVVQSKVTELLGQIASAQESTLRSQERESALTRQVYELEKQMAEFKAWEAEKQRYQLTDFGGGTFAYLLKSGMESGEPSHRLCAGCFQKGEKSILQFRGQNAYSQDTYTCPSCKTDFRFGVQRDPPSHANSGPGGKNAWMTR